MSETFFAVSQYYEKDYGTPWM